MNPTQVILEGMLQPDGTLVLDRKPELPPGRVQVTLQVLPASRRHEPLWQVAQSIREELKASGHVPRSKEEIDAAHRALNRGMENEIAEAIRLQEESRRLREEADRAGRGEE
jgi:hypothetical protein